MLRRSAGVGFSDLSQRGDHLFPTKVAQRLNGIDSDSVSWIVES